MSLLERLDGAETVVEPDCPIPIWVGLRMGTGKEDEAVLFQQPTPGAVPCVLPEDLREREVSEAQQFVIAAPNGPPTVWLPFVFLNHLSRFAQECPPASGSPASNRSTSSSES